MNLIDVCDGTGSGLPKWESKADADLHLSPIIQDHDQHQRNY